MGHPERRVRPKRRSVVDPVTFGEIDPEFVEEISLAARRRRLLPPALLYIASVVMVGALAPWVNLVLLSLFPLGLALGVARQRWPVPPSVAGVLRLILLAAWIWCVGWALTGSWQMTSVAAPLIAVVTAVAVARTKSRTSSRQ